jgi:hypothetical protein
MSHSVDQLIYHEQLDCSMLYISDGTISDLSYNISITLPAISAYDSDNIAFDVIPVSAIFPTTNIS